MAYFNVIFGHLPREIEETHEMSVDRKSTVWSLRSAKLASSTFGGMRGVLPLCPIYSFMACNFNFTCLREYPYLRSGPAGNCQAFAAPFKSTVSDQLVWTTLRAAGDFLISLLSTTLGAATANTVVMHKGMRIGYVVAVLPYLFLMLRVRNVSPLTCKRHKCIMQFYCHCVIR
jgi:hypothetical protein